ncbi:hypothetical protein VTJ49DRAFT_1312 [Mycothermus thermophilus]|uniref:Dolichyl-diphosphooligosaccharide--protein glycosyltransferase subunit 4 n=1 Tax=Humicola insolens TaxID=85995 RepID=A0ABR3VCP0_HUMIN
MISDTELYRLAIVLGSAAAMLIILYHFLEVNSDKKESDANAFSAITDHNIKKPTILSCCLTASIAARRVSSNHRDTKPQVTLDHLLESATLPTTAKADKKLLHRVAH